MGQRTPCRAERDAELAVQRLRYVLGLQLADYAFEPAESTALPQLRYDVNTLVDEAVSSRADLRAIQLAVGAAERRAELASRSIWQITGLLPDINGQGRKGFEAGPGLQMLIPIFHQNQGEVAQALADAARLRRQYVNQRDMAAFEVQAAHIQVLQAMQDLEIWNSQVVPQSIEAVASARAALQEDGVALALVLDTTRQWITARQRELESRAQLRRAVAELERSVGRTLVRYTGDGTGESESLPVPEFDTM